MFEIAYNKITFNLHNPDENLKVNCDDSVYITSKFSSSKIMIHLKYDNISIRTNHIHQVYVILQHLFKVDTIEKLASLSWDYTKWNFNITYVKLLPDWAKILNCLLNDTANFNKPIKISVLEDTVKLNDKRGWGGERPREVYYKLGFPLFTPKTNKTLKNSERLFVCPFPICRINPRRKAIIVDTTQNEKRCFTCGKKEGEMNILGESCYFEKGHLVPHMNNGTEKCSFQCKWCNTFYKDKLSWNKETGKPTFNIYAILRDSPKHIIIENLKKLGFTSSDLV